MPYPYSIILGLGNGSAVSLQYYFGVGRRHCRVLLRRNQETAVPYPYSIILGLGLGLEVGRRDDSIVEEYSATAAIVAL